MRGNIGLLTASNLGLDGQLYIVLNRFTTEWRRLTHSQRNFKSPTSPVYYSSTQDMITRHNACVNEQICGATQKKMKCVRYCTSLGGHTHSVMIRYTCYQNQIHSSQCCHRFLTTLTKAESCCVTRLGNHGELSNNMQKELPWSIPASNQHGLLDTSQKTACLQMGITLQHLREPISIV